jgi:uncharacterized protein (DUF1015 family)
MSVIKPFKGFRPPVNIVEKLASRPYDVLNTEEARKECEGNPYSLLHVTKAEIDLPAGIKDTDPEVYLQVVKTTIVLKTMAGWCKTKRKNSTSTPKAWTRKNGSMAS